MKILKWLAYISLTLYVIPVYAVIAISAGGSHTCALKNSGQVVCWGGNLYGQITVPTDLSHVQAISAGGKHTCALTNDGQVVCWGEDFNGQTTPPTGLSHVQAIAAGGEHTCALINDGQVVCWGNNNYGQATPPTGLSNLQAIAAGFYHTCALTNDGQVVCWGGDFTGQATPPTGLSHVKAISAGGSLTCALTNDGQVVCWGDNSFGQVTFPSISLSTELSNLTVSGFGDNVLVEWETGVELKNVGFRLRRAIEDQNGGYDAVVLGESDSNQILDSNGSCSNEIQGQLKIIDPNQNSSPISAIGNSRESTCYSFTDTNSLSDGTYYYLLEDIGDNGKITFHCDQINAVTIGQGPAIDLESAINYCKEVTGSNN